MADAPTQTLAIPAKFSRFAPTIGFQPTAARKLRIVIASEFGDGKTTFSQSIPKSATLDFDRAGNNVFGGRSTVFPIPNWRVYEELQKALVEDAQTATPTFERVIFDTTDSFIDILDPHLVDEKRASVKDPSGFYASMRSIIESGQGGYTTLRAAVIKQLNTFYFAGLPWMALCQLKTKKEVVENNTVEFQRSLMYPSIYDLLCSYADVVAVLTSRKVTKKIPTVTDIGGRKVTTMTTKDYVGHFLVIKEVLDSTNQKRRILDMTMEIEVPPVDGWATFEAAYADAIANAIAKNTTPAALPEAK